MTRNGFLKSLLGGTAIAGIPAVKSVEVLEMKPDDALVITVPGAISQENANRIYEFVQAKFPDRKIMVLSEGLEVKVLRA